MEVTKRLSHSFPPDYTENNKYLAEVHSVIQHFNVQIDPKNVQYRLFEDEDDIAEIRQLHKEWFPMNYPDKFFYQISQKETVKTLMAIYPFAYQDKTYSLILGCLTYEYRPLNHDLIRFSCSDLYCDKYGIYILTFGIINEVRSLGIGSILLQNLLQLAEKYNQIKYFYLDVIAYNDSGIRCYEKNGFVKVYTKTLYYNVFGKVYDAYVYCKYVNGAKKPYSAKELLCGCVTLCGIPTKIVKTIKNQVSRKLDIHRRASKYKELKV